MISLADLPKDAASYNNWPLEQLIDLAKPIMLLEYLGGSSLADGRHYLTDSAFAEIQAIWKQLSPVSYAVIDAIAARDWADVVWNNPGFAPEYQSYIDDNDYGGLVLELTRANPFRGYDLGDPEIIDNATTRLQKDVQRQLKSLFSERIGQAIQEFNLVGISMNRDAFQPRPPLMTSSDTKLIASGTDQSMGNEQNTP